MVFVMRPHIVIIGGGFGGLTVARGLKNAAAQVTLVDRSNHHLFQPLLYQVATAGLSPADIAAPIRAVLRNQENTEVWMGEVTGINPQEKTILMKNGTLQYDYLVIATGARYNYFGHRDWPKAAPGLKSVTDATLIRRKILLAFESAEIETDPEKKKIFLTFVLVGAGPTGVEMAGSIAELAHHALRSDFRHLDPTSARVILIEAGPRILASFSDKLAKKAEKRLRSLGVEILTQTRVQELDAEGVRISEERLHSKTVIWCAGVIASPAGEWLKAEVDRAGRVKVGPDLSVPSCPDIFVIGDTAACTEEGKLLPGVAPVAMQQGKFIAKLLIRRLKTGKSEPLRFHYINKGNLATVGRSFAIAEFHGLQLSGIVAWFVWLVVHIYYLISFRNRAAVVMQWAWAYFTFQRGARLITMENAE